MKFKLLNAWYDKNILPLFDKKLELEFILNHDYEQWFVCFLFSHILVYIAEDCDAENFMKIKYNMSCI